MVVKNPYQWTWILGSGHAISLSIVKGTPKNDFYKAYTAVFGAKNVNIGIIDYGQGKKTLYPGTNMAPIIRSYEIAKFS